MIEPGIGTEDQLSGRTPLYSSKRSFKNLWQEYRIYIDRIELQFWLFFNTFKIPLNDITEIELADPFSFVDLFRKKSRRHLMGVKIDQSDFCRHIALTRKSGFIKHISFTPDNPDEFADIIKLLMDDADKVMSLRQPQVG